MDRQRRRSGLLIGAAALGLLAAAPPAVTLLKGQRWLPAGADAARLLTQRPAECLKVPLDPEAVYQVELGRAAFRTPLILGGQAARAGIACETCHQNGRTNRNFAFPGVSGPPGTADVTNSLFSSHRGDGVDNPRPIPDLGAAREALKVDETQGSGALETFIHGLVTQEFDGPEPPPAVLKGLAAYVRAMGPGACPRTAVVPVNAGGAGSDARRAVRTALLALKRNDPEAAGVMVMAARSQLGALTERYARPRLAVDRRALLAADADLGAALVAIRAGRPDASERLTVWLAQSGDWAAMLARDEGRSLYNRRVLAAAIGH